MYRVYDNGLKTLPPANNAARTLYRDAFNKEGSPQFMTGVECALDFNRNKCNETAVTTTGHVDICAQHNQAMWWCNGELSPTEAPNSMPAPTEAPAPTPTEAP